MIESTIIIHTKNSAAIHDSKQRANRSQQAFSLTKEHKKERNSGVRQYQTVFVCACVFERTTFENKSGPAVSGRLCLCIFSKSNFETHFVAQTSIFIYATYRCLNETRTQRRIDDAKHAAEASEAKRRLRAMPSAARAAMENEVCTFLIF